MEHKAIKIEQQDEEDDAGKQQQKEPPKKVTISRGGQERDYNYLKTVKSMEELNNYRLENYCIVGLAGRKALPNFESHTMPCKLRYKQKKCNYEFLAVRQKPESDTIDVYAHSKHNHQLMPGEKRASIRGAKEKELMPAENPSKVFRTEDNIAWTYLETCADYEQLQQFQRKSQCTISTGRENHRRVSLPCKHRRSHNCEFKLLSLKITKQGYHVYKLGKHNHPVIKPKKKQQPAARGRQQKQEAMEVDEEESKDEEGEEGQDEPIQQGGENEDDIIVIGDEDDMIKVEPKEEVKQKDSKGKTTETPLENEATLKKETLDEKVQKAVTKAHHEWMATIQPNQIELKVMELDIAALCKMVEMADQEIKQHPAKFNLWRPWLKHAMQKCMSEVEDFANKYKDLIGLMLRHVQA